MKSHKKRFNKLTKRRRKADHCLNCGNQFDKSFNYCPSCGQENNHNQASTRTLVLDFLNNYFSLDSKFSMSLLPFFLKPGYLTLKFLQGKRASFVNPIRLYLIISLVFFFVFSMISKDLIQESIDTFDKTTAELNDSSKQIIDKVLAGEFTEFETDTVIQLTSSNPDSTTSNYSLSLTKADSTNTFVTDENIQTYLKLRTNYEYSVDEVMDSLETSTLSGFQYNLAKQLMRLDRAEGQIVLSQLLKNLPLMMLFTLPISALLLKLLYMRRNQFYITHLVHTLHLHSFAYLIYGFVFVAAMYWLPEGSISTYSVLFGMLVVTVHSYLSFLNVYGQKWFKTLVKFSVAGFVYTWVQLLAIFVEMIISVYTY